MSDLRFATAAQMVCMLALGEEQGARCTSEALAQGIDINPVIVRRLLIPLVRDGIVASAVGKNGGVRLGRSPDRISLLDIYRAVVPTRRLLSPRSEVPDRCVVSGNIEAFLGRVSDEAEAAAEKVLANRTVASSLAEMHRMQQREVQIG